MCKHIPVSVRCNHQHWSAQCLSATKMTSASLIGCAPYKHHAWWLPRPNSLAVYQNIKQKKIEKCWCVCAISISVTCGMCLWEHGLNKIRGGCQMSLLRPLLQRSAPKFPMLGCSKHKQSAGNFLVIKYWVLFTQDKYVSYSFFPFSVP
jgi:hypothetical protein